MRNPSEDIEEFLHAMHAIEEEIKRIIGKSDLTNEEKAFILKHIVVIPG